MVPKISVFVTSYNQRHYLSEAIESLLSQTLKPFEIIVVDDCSTDGSRELIEEYAKSNQDLVRPIYHNRNLGIPVNKAFAQAQARGDWLTYLDGDDRFLPRKLELEWERLQNSPDSRMVFSDFYLIDEAGSRFQRWAEGSEPASGYVFREVFARLYPRDMVFRNELVAYDCLKEVGFYRHDCVTHHDWDLKIRLTKRYPVTYCPVPLMEYRKHPGGISASSSSFRLQQMFHVYCRNRSLLDSGVSEPERAFIEERLTKLFERRAREMVRTALFAGDIKRAFRSFREFRHLMGLERLTPFGASRR